MNSKILSTGGLNVVQLLSRRPPTNVSVTSVDFNQLGLCAYKNHFAMLIDNLFTKSECEALLAGAETSSGSTWEQAMINVGNGQQKMATDVRLCDRIMWDDHEVAAKILDRIVPHLPSDIVTLRNRPLVTGKGPVKRKEDWTISRLNERLRFLKYTEGMYFRTHCDGSYVTPDDKEISFLTVHLYLNGDDTPPATQWGGAMNQDKPLLGGATRFLAPDWETSWDVNPKVGSVLVFQHRNLMHSGEDVRQGTKYTLRSDILYRKIEV